MKRAHFILMLSVCASQDSDYVLEQVLDVELVDPDLKNF